MSELVNAVIAYENEVIALVLALFCLLRWQFVPADRKRTELLMVVTVLSIPLQGSTHLIALALVHVRSIRYDLYINRLDEMFGEPSFMLGQTLVGHPGMQAVLGLSYTVLPIVMVCVFATYLWLRPRVEAWTVAYAFALNLVAAVPIYLALPVCGPYYAFPDFPNRPPELSPHPIALAEIPNGIPSVHMSTALLVLWFLRRWPTGRILGAIYLVLTVYATLGSGQHYLVDLICALPYAAAIVWLARRISSCETFTDSYALAAECQVRIDQSLTPERESARTQPNTKCLPIVGSTST